MIPRTPSRLVLLLLAWPALGHADPDAAPASDEPVKDDAPKPREPARHKHFYVFGGAAHVAPLASSRELELADVDGPASLAVHDGPIPGSGSTISSATVPAFIVGYTLPVLDGRLGLETVLGLPFTVKFEATGTLANQSIAPDALGIPTGVGPLGSELGEASAAPVVLTTTYKLIPNGRIDPYVGAGVACLFAFNAHITNKMLTAVQEPQFDISPAPGLVLQTGVQVKLTGAFYARLDVKFIAFMMAHAEVHHLQIHTPDLPLFDTVEVGTAKMNVWVNPLIIQAGVGAEF